MAPERSQIKAFLHILSGEKEDKSVIHNPHLCLDHVIRLTGCFSLRIKREAIVIQSSFIYTVSVTVKICLYEPEPGASPRSRKNSRLSGGNCERYQAPMEDPTVGDPNICLSFEKFHLRGSP